MILNHINLTVSDVPAASAFLETYFGLQRTGGNAGMAFLTDNAGFILSIMKASKATEVHYPGNFHIGFFVESKATVDAINRRLKDDGYAVEAPQQHHAYTFYVTAPGGFTVELGA